MGNPLSATRMDMLNSSKAMWQTVSDSMSSNQIYYMSLLRNFYSAWVNSGYDAAKATLPKDNPATHDVNEEVTETMLGEKANHFLGKPTNGSAGWIPTPGGNTSPDDLNKLLQSNIGVVKAKVQEYLGQKSIADDEADAIDGQIKQLEIEQESDTSGSQDPSSITLPS